MTDYNFANYSQRFNNGAKTCSINSELRGETAEVNLTGSDPFR